MAGKTVKQIEAEEALVEALAPTKDLDGEVSAKEELVELSSMYLEADRQEKEGKERKALLRGPILDLMSEAVRDEIPLATKTVDLPKEEIDTVFGGDVRKWLALKYPEWQLMNVEVLVETNYLRLTIQEDDALVKYEFSVDGQKFGRTVQHSAPSVDAEALRDDEEFSALPAEDVVVEVKTYELDEKAAARFLSAHPESAPIFARHTRPGAVTAKLLPFKPMKEDA
jgi:hypothetical protein